MFTAIGVGAAALGGAAMQADAARDASAAQSGATNRAAALTKGQYDTTRSDQAPYREAGNSALQKLMTMLGFGDPSGVNKPTMETARQAALDDHIRRFGVGYVPGVSRQEDIAAGEQQMFDKMMADYNAKVSGGVPATDPAFGALSSKFSVNDFWKDPVTQLGYQSGLDLGTKALKNAAPLTFGSDSGAAMKELTKFGEDYAGSKAGESYNRFEGDKSNVFNRLMALIGGGQVSNQVTANAGNNMATTNAGLITAGGNAQGAAKIAQANAGTGALSNISNWWQAQQNNQQQERMWNQMIGARTNGGFAF